MVSNKALGGTARFPDGTAFLPTLRFYSDVLPERLLAPASQVTLCNSPVSGEAMQIEKKEISRFFFFRFLSNFEGFAALSGA